MGQVYSRSRDYNGMHAIMYSWYMPKDQNIDRHTHDWENVIVWLSSKDNPEIKGISYSAHSGYERIQFKVVDLWSGDRPKVAYYAVLKNHALEGTTEKGGEQPLIAWHALTPAARFTLTNYDFGDANVPFKATNFLKNLEKGKI